jgi:hypothetical protein
MFWLIIVRENIKSLYTNIEFVWLTLYTDYVKSRMQVHTNEPLQIQSRDMIHNSKLHDTQASQLGSLTL